MTEETQNIEENKEQIQDKCEHETFAEKLQICVENMGTPLDQLLAEDEFHDEENTPKIEFQYAVTIHVLAEFLRRRCKDFNTIVAKEEVRTFLGRIYRAILDDDQLDDDNVCPNSEIKCQLSEANKDEMLNFLDEFCQRMLKIREVISPKTKEKLDKEIEDGLNQESSSE